MAELMIKNAVELIPDNIEQVIFMLHGYGANGTNLFRMVKLLNDKLHNTAFIAPNAPFPYEYNQDGCYQWCSLRDRNLLDDEVMKVSVLLEQYFAQEQKRLKLSNQRIILLGFSQGAAMAVQYGLSHNICDAILAFSGRVYTPGLLKSGIISQPKVALIHGTDDEIVTIDNMYYSKSILEELKIDVVTKEISGLEHSINYEGLQFAIDFLKKL